MDLNHLRQNAIDSTEKVAFTPEWGKARLQQMLENHPEWCISRQRTWGTPIPALICTACNESFLDPAVARKTAQRFADAGADSWWRDDISIFVPEGTKCPKCGATEFQKEKNIVDIWFESGVTHFAVLGKDKPYGMPWPSDLVLEGGDQYRGWFRSSLVTAVAVKGVAPYKRVVKNGWVNDEQGRPMSKSRGTGIDARDAMNKWGADVLRLWGASVEFIDDVRFGPNVVAQVGNVYRNIRNRIRFMLSNLYDLEPENILAIDDMEPIDALACNVTDQWVRRVQYHYNQFQIHDAYLEIIRFEGDDLSSFYLDSLKDRLYSEAANSRRRRSAQSALWHILRSFLAVVAPILSFTTEEAWQNVSEALRDNEVSIFDVLLAKKQADNIVSEMKFWAPLKKLRAQVAANTIARDFEAKAHLKITPGFYQRFADYFEGNGQKLRDVLVVSQVSYEIDSSDYTGMEDLENAEIEVSTADGEKCARCWKYRELGTDPEHPGICADCAAVVTNSTAA